MYRGQYISPDVYHGGLNSFPQRQYTDLQELYGTPHVHTSINFRTL